MTAYDRCDAESIVSADPTVMSFKPMFRECVEDVDVSQLDQGHVIPNMGIVVDRGIWFPKR